MKLFLFVTFVYLLKAIIFLILWSKHRNKNNKNLLRKDLTLSVDIIVPMFNEEKIILKTISNLLVIRYPNYRIIIVDDGSTDKSLSMVKKTYSQLPNIIIVEQQNQGKSFALNNGISHSDSDVVVCIDADTLVSPDIIQKLIPHFNDDKVVAVSGNIRVGNKQNFMTKMQNIEYITNQNYDRLIFQRLNGIMVVPGAIGAFRTKIIKKLGGYAPDTLTEDTEITMRILCNDYLIKNASEAYGFTEAPETIKMFIKQRTRWNIGTIQVLIKYHQKIVNHNNRYLKFIVFPYTWLYGIFLPLVTSILDYIVFFSIINNDMQFLSSYFLCVFIDSLICAVILLNRGESSRNIAFVPLQRFMLRQFTVIAYFYILVKFLKGDLKKWDKIVRYGTVRLD